MIKTVLITGANKGIGLEFVKQFSSKGYKVIATCRRSTKAKELRALQGNILIRELDITAENQLQDLKDSLSGVPIDILILNAGVVGQRDIALGNLDIDDFVDTLKTNVIYTLKVLDSFFNNLLLGSDKKVVAISSIMGSIENSSGGYYSYRGSKAALNAIMKSVAIDQDHNGIKVLLLHPGWVKTEMGGQNAHIEANESVLGMIDIIESNFKSGDFLDYKNNKLLW
jgi:NAD(P)-dependent dehydrogenase (short-subunit alcohol dehydrogenase family)